MIRVYALLALGALFVVCVFVLFGSMVGEKNRKKAILRALDADGRRRGEADKQNVKDMVALYLNMVAKHGADSDEAKAFRFGTDSALLRHLHEDDDALAAFNQQADIIDETCRQLKRTKSRSAAGNVEERIANGQEPAESAGETRPTGTL